MDWFFEAFGIEEPFNFDQVRNEFKVEGSGDETILIVKENGRKFEIGEFETPTVLELVKRAKSILSNGSIKKFGGIKFENIIGNSRSLHLDPKNEGAVFQVASQFNCLEMVNPYMEPRHGITGYVDDRTQGPVCAMACPAATLYRNYFAGAIPGKGQDKNQLDNAAEIAKLVNNGRHKYWAMTNGYLLPVRTNSLKALNKRFDEKVNVDGQNCNLSEAISLKLRVGVQWNTETARHGLRQPHRLCQVFCSAVPLSYCSNATDKDFEKLGCAILNGSYEATLAVGTILAAQRRQRVSVYWTCVGGGVFGNPHRWIASAMQRSLDRWCDAPINVKLVHFRRRTENIIYKKIEPRKLVNTQYTTLIEDDEKKHSTEDDKGLLDGKKSTLTISLKDCEDIKVDKSETLGDVEDVKEALPVIEQIT